jgi:hypothetical protein
MKTEMSQMSQMSQMSRKVTECHSYVTAMSQLLGIISAKLLKKRKVVFSVTFRVVTSPIKHVHSLKKEKKQKKETKNAVLSGTARAPSGRVILCPDGKLVQRTPPIAPWNRIHTLNHRKINTLDYLDNIWTKR